MKITDSSDKPISDYNPIIDTEVDIYAPYIDFTHAENKEDVQIPVNGVYDTLFYKDTPLMTVDKIAELEIRYYSSDTPNENYRIGQKHVKARILDIQQIPPTESDVDDGWKFKFDISKQWAGEIQTFSLSKTYIDTVRARCIAILYFNSTGRVIGEFLVPASDWCTSNVYLNSAFTQESEEPFAFKVGDIVDTVIYKKHFLDDTETTFTIVEEELTGKITDLKLTYRTYTVVNENGEEDDAEIYYYLISLDLSEEFRYNTVMIASNVIKTMKIHKIVPEV